MSEFIFFFRGRRNFDAPDRARQNAQKWQAWFKALGADGRMTAPGHRTSLEGTGKVVRGNERTVSDGPYAEAKDVVSGCARIEARDLVEAVEVSKGCPIFEVGGSVEVRPILKPKV